MKARFTLAASLALSLAATAGVVVEELPGTVALTEPVRLTDGHVLPAAPYDVKIHYQGFGNTAEIWFFTGGVFKGKTNAEARGFPSLAPAGAAAPGDAKLKKYDPEIKGETDPAAGKVFPKVEGPDDKVDKKYIKMSPATATESFSWGAHGFQKGMKGQAVSSIAGFVKLSFDSANSPAAFVATLPVAGKLR